MVPYEIIAFGILIHSIIHSINSNQRTMSAIIHLPRAHHSEDHKVITSVMKKENICEASYVVQLARMDGKGRMYRETFIVVGKWCSGSKGATLRRVLQCGQERLKLPRHGNFGWSMKRSTKNLEEVKAMLLSHIRASGHEPCVAELGFP